MNVKCSDATPISPSGILNPANRNEDCSEVGQGFLMSATPLNLECLAAEFHLTNEAK